MKDEIKINTKISSQKAFICTKTKTTASEYRNDSVNNHEYICFC
jgi:hypothetical protein